MADKGENVDRDSDDLPISQEQTSDSRGILVSGTQYNFSGLGLHGDEATLYSAMSNLSIEEKGAVNISGDNLTKKESDKEVEKERNIVESPDQPPIVNTNQKDQSSETVSTASQLESCPICLQTPVHPVKLPCSHIFCFLCLKGMGARDLRCGLCRTPFSREVMENPTLLGEGQPRLSDLAGKLSNSKAEYSWFYQARSSGWWLYEERVSNEIEDAYSKNQPKTRVYISGYQYIIDFANMMQYRESHPERTRKIKRDKCSPSSRDIKGVAGIKVSPN